ncbi:MAG TPA: branched-chain amino acid ABC transporter permease [Magnetospirillaceae bacterium]|jgi:branched-chain amino acid transport system permease protein
MDFFLSYIILAEIYILLALSTNLLVGITGIFSVSQAAVFGVGAYVCSSLTLNEGWPFGVALLAAIVCCVVINVLLSLPSLRVSGDYFIVTSFGIQFLCTAVFENWSSATGGTSGLPGIPTPQIFGLHTEEPAYFVWMSTFALIIGCLCFQLVLRSPFGRLLGAIREDEIAVAAIGRNVLRGKINAAALSGAYSGVAGSLYGAFLSFIDPSSFDMQASILLVSMVVVGGARTMAGSIIGPAFLIGLPQLLAFVNISSSIAGPLRQLVYGVLLVVFMLFRPSGLAGKRL